MGSDWREIALGDVLEIKYGKDHKKLREGSIPCYGSGGVMRYVCEFLYDEESILIPRKGSLNNIYFVDEPFWTVDTLFWSKVNKKLADPKFIFYQLKLLDFNRLNEGSAVPSMTVPLLNNIKLKLPPIKIQHEISEILSELDTKIELNRQTNQTLEQMAQALFKSWFVDFDPVIDNTLAAGNKLPDELAARVAVRKRAHKLPYHKPLPADIQKLFPSEFEQTEDPTIGIEGWIPKGWHSKPVSEAIQINPRTSLKKGQIAKFADMKALPTSGFIIDEIISKGFNGGTKFKQHDILLARITPCLENGKTALVNFLDKDEVGFGSTEFVVMREKGDITYSYIACLARLESFRLHCIQNMVGSSGRQRVQNSCFDSYYLAVPQGLGLLQQFDNICRPLFEKMGKLSAQGSTLSAARDCLLPKLISGEITLNKLAERSSA